MAKLFGREYTREQLLSYVGDLSQVAGVELAEMGDGNERGNRIAKIRSGSGLNFTVILDRGMDTGAAEFKGRPLAWISPVGFTSPAFYEPEGLNWLYTFGGGMMVGCGLTALGSPSVDDGENLGLHGRLSFLPARKVNTGETWNGDECSIWVEGELRQARVHFENLAVTRRISTGLGKNYIRYEDIVENRASKPSPLMILYHINVGFPMLSENSTLVAKAHNVEGRDGTAETGIKNWDHFQKPTPGYEEQVFYHDLAVDEKGWCSIDLISPDAGLKMTVKYNHSGLNRLTEWKMMGKGTYVLGLEPCNCEVGGRDLERKSGRLQYIQPGEKRHFEVEIHVEELK
jgi:hypothetical protein